MSTIFLHGGDDPAWRSETFGRFAQATLARPDRPVALLIYDEDDAEYENAVEQLEIIFKVVGVPPARLHPLRVDYREPLNRQTLEQLQPGGVLVAGGHTPAYSAALCRDTGWVDYVREAGIPLLSRLGYHRMNHQDAKNTKSHPILGVLGVLVVRPFRPLL